MNVLDCKFKDDEDAKFYAMCILPQLKLKTKKARIRRNVRQYTSTRLLGAAGGSHTAVMGQEAVPPPGSHPAGVPPEAT